MVNSINYQYDENKLRIVKQVDSNMIKYYYEGNRMLSMVEYNASNQIVSKIHFHYDCFSGIIGFCFNGTDYIYIKDILGQIIGIIDRSGNLIVKYRYDAFGNHVVLNANNEVEKSLSFIGNINPFRYKGYYYDVRDSSY